MGFNQNPHVAKAEAAAQKAQLANDESARTLAWLEAAHQWERAAHREKNPKKVTEYEKNAEEARREAEPASPGADVGQAAPAPAAGAAPSPRGGLTLVRGERS